MRKLSLMGVMLLTLSVFAVSCDLADSSSSAEDGKLGVTVSADTTSSKAMTLSSGLEVESIKIIVTKVDVVKKGSDDAEKEETSAKGFKSEQADSSDSKDKEDSESSGTYTVLETNKEIDLLKINDAANDLLGEVELEPGDYLQLRFIISPDSGKIVFKNDPTEYALKVPSGSSSGLKIKGTGKNPLFTITEGERSDLELNIDVPKSLVIGTTKQGYFFKPVMKRVKFQNKEKEFGSTEN